jgi:hypothetical protein
LQDKSFEKYLLALSQNSWIQFDLTAIFY